jgi:hypothetical protein
LPRITRMEPRIKTECIRNIYLQIIKIDLVIKTFFRHELHEWNHESSHLQIVVAQQGGQEKTMFIVFNYNYPTYYNYRLS